uniref:7TM_GPCR_Srx domain-containing protein n=1 Tax=Steinernema glaseri TaxID=37863 RepID=A0A1I7ZGZ4_9BILA
MANIGIIDCMFLAAILEACIMTLAQSTVAGVLFEKCRFRNGITIESHEMRILFQGLVTFVPGTTYWILSLVANWNFTDAPPALNIAFTILPRLVPVVNVCGYLLLNG